MDGLHIVDVTLGKHVWVIHLSNGKVFFISTFEHPDELSAYATATNRLKQKEQTNGTNA